MTATEVKGCLYLLGQLWQNYQLPQNEAGMTAAVNTWLRFFGNVPEKAVTQTILEISADGDAFPPQVGQIYARLKSQRLEAHKDEAEPYCNFETYAAVVGVQPPAREAGPEGWWKWYGETRAALHRRA